VDDVGKSQKLVVDVYGVGFVMANFKSKLSMLRPCSSVLTKGNFANQPLCWNLSMQRIFLVFIALE
jgi:hypothetical protein